MPLISIQTYDARFQGRRLLLQEAHLGYIKASPSDKWQFILALIYLFAS